MCELAGSVPAPLSLGLDSRRASPLSSLHTCAACGGGQEEKGLYSFVCVSTALICMLHDDTPGNQSYGR